MFEPSRNSGAAQTPKVAAGVSNSPRTSPPILGGRPLPEPTASGLTPVSRIPEATFQGVIEQVYAKTVIAKLAWTPGDNGTYVATSGSSTVTLDHNMIRIDTRVGGHTFRDERPYLSDTPDGDPYHLYDLFLLVARTIHKTNPYEQMQRDFGM